MVDFIAQLVASCWCFTPAVLVIIEQLIYDISKCEFCINTVSILIPVSVSAAWRVSFRMLILLIIYVSQ